jgi:general secretion pathway protein J
LPILEPTLRNNPGLSAKGFTLLEVLVAIAVFAILSLAAYQILQGVLRSGEISREHSTSLTELQRAMLMIEQDFTQIVARRSRDENGDEDELRVITAGDSLFESEDQGIEFTRLGWANPLGLLPRSDLVRVRYRLKEGQLQRLYFLYPDLQAGQEPQVQVLLNDIEKLSFRFWNNGWKDRWAAAKKLPKGIEIKFTSKRYSEIRRAFLVAPGEAS